MHSGIEDVENPFPVDGQGPKHRVLEGVAISLQSSHTPDVFKQPKYLLVYLRLTTP